MASPDITPHERYDQDVSGLPVYAAVMPLAIIITPENMADAVPADDEHCAIAEGCRTQFHTPYVSVGRSRTDLALPHPDGVEKPGYKGKWAIHRFFNPDVARHVIIAADTGQLDGEGVFLVLHPPRDSDRPEAKRQRNKRFREPKGITDGRGKQKTLRKNELTLLGVRDLTGQRKR